MTALIPMPDERAPTGAPRLWINPAQIVTAAAIVDRAHQPPRLFVELKLVGVNLTRYWLASGTDEQLQEAWDAFAVQLGSGEGNSTHSDDVSGSP